MQIIRADQSAFDPRPQMAKIFADGFTQWLSYFSSDPKKIEKAFAHMFVLDQFYIAVKADAVAAMAACTDCHTLAVHLRPEELRHHLGFFKGTLAKLVLKGEFEKPFKEPPADTGSIEYVGTAVPFRGQGVASRLLRYILDDTPYHTFLIEEVADTNQAAMALYQKLGFAEYRRTPIPAKRAEKIGISALISLRYEKPQPY